MNNVLDGKVGTLTILLADPHTEIATSKVIELVNDLSNKNIPILLYEFNSYEKWYKLNLKRATLRKSNIYLERKSYLEDICYKARNYKALYDIQYLIIDGLTEINTIYPYCLGRGDIVSIIIIQLKELAQELNISIIATAPTSSETTIDELNSNPSIVLSFFCKGKTAIEFIDNIYLLDMDIIQKLNEYGFSNQVKKTLIDYCNSKPLVSKDYILSVAESWHKNNIKTEEDLDNCLKKYEILDKINTKISKIIERPTTEYEKLYIEKWIYKNNIDEKQLVELVKSNKTNFDRIDKIIMNDYKQV